MRPKASGFNPRSISGLAMWLDASDGATLFQNSDGTVPATATSDPIGYWGDKSGNGRHVTQSISASRPTLTTVATKTAVNFDGTDDTIWFQQGVTSNNLSVFCVFKCDTLNGGIVYDCGYTSDNTNTQYSNQTGFMNAAGLQISVAGVPAHRLDSMRSFISNDQGRSGLAGSVAANAVALSTVAATYGTTPLRYAAKNGNEVTGTLRFNGTIWSVVSLGARRNAGTFPPPASVFLDGQICEFLIYEQNLPQSQRRRVESYLATKWGITLARVPNADAEAWINNVYANSASVSDATAEAVNTFCYAIDSAGIRDKFYRLNIFAGTGLGAARVPLYSSTAIGGTTYGNATDTNTGFTSGDYVEAAGLTGTGNNGVGAGQSKSLNTGLLPTAWPSISSFHVSAFAFGVTQSQPVQSSPIGIRNNTAPANRWGFDYRQTATQFHSGDNLSNLPAMPTVATDQHWVATRASVTSASGFINGVSQYTNTTDVTATLIARANPFFVFAQNSDTLASAFSPLRLGGYSLGASLSAQQAYDFCTAIRAVQASLGRTTFVHGEALAWKGAVIANGGSVSDNTLAAVNAFCNAIDAAGCRGKFVRLNLFCGTNLASALVPLYRGQAIYSTQFGNTTDTNIGPFVSGDYSELTGLQGNGTSKYLDTGVAGNVVTTSSRHLAAYERINATTDYSPTLGHYSVATNTHWRLGVWTQITNYIYAAFSGVGGQPSFIKNTGFILGQNESSTSGKLFRNGINVATTLSGAASSVDSSTVKVLGQPGEWSEACLGSYSIGQTFTGTEVIAYSNAMIAFQTALGRNV